jgi:serine/threonine protein kinase/formylglycine-generating enzyme required for sulfatase activity
MKSAETTSLGLGYSAEAVRLIDGACSNFEEALRRGELPSIEGILASAGAESRQQLLRELLAREMEFRSSNGEMPTLEQFRQRFPNDAALAKYLYLEHFVPERLAGFSIQRLLGRGTFGHVYQGWDGKLTRNVAIKVFRRDPMDPRSRAGSLLAEARTVAQLRHPGLVTVYGVQQDDDGDEFLILEYVDGRSLEDLLRADRIGPQEAARLMLEVVQALQHAHHHGVVHRDLKPANILLDSSRRPRVTDFGLALHVSTSRRPRELAGTLAYMAPEQASGETHRLDARTDLWAVGVVLYRMLVGKLPFVGSSREELLSAIRYSDPRDLRDIDPRISPELERIVRRCLAKRMSDRYQSAAEVAEDLAAYLSPGTVSPQANIVEQDKPVVVVPKGLRCFDASDRDFFLSLVPGPRDRNGVPSAIGFWERHLQELDRNATFRVGLLYGPSGCGKSSLVRAGILPRLPQHVVAIVVDGARGETESVLLRQLLLRFPDIAPDATLPEALWEVRVGSHLGPGQKLLVVFDQFEQWLHGWNGTSVATLVDALRQCDGGRVQSLILVRDDFWMPATRFFQQLDVALVEGVNTCAVDLFDPAHATKVLTAFGVAYGRLDARHQSQEQTRFLTRAVTELSEDGWIVPVRLCIFAEMIKARPWSPATLQQVGGAQGLGTAFLEEVFDGRSASPMHRLHRKAARLSLERLLPPPGTNIRGHLVAESELRQVSGYEQRPEEFTGLLRCLDSELRLITLSNPGAADGPGDASAPRQYQLTHDFLVTALRAWLNQSRRRTVRGRAELRLTDHAEAYAARQETRQLPSWWEWLSILLFTSARRWSTADRAMMRSATRLHLLRSGLIMSAALLVGLFVYDRMAAVRAEELVQALATSDSRDVPQAAARLTAYGRWTRPRLLERMEFGSPDAGQRIRLLSGLQAVGEPRDSELLEALGNAEPPLTVAIADVLSRFGKLPDLESRLWLVASASAQPPGRRLRAMCGLARLDSAAESEHWPIIAETTSALLLNDVTENPGYFTTWVDAFAPARRWLTPPLRASFMDPARSESARALIANILAQYLADNPAELVELALNSAPRQFDVFFKALGSQADPLRGTIAAAASSAIAEDATEEDKDALARRKANAILLLRELGNDQPLWPSLSYAPDPRVRSFLINHLRQVLTSPEQFSQHLADEDPGVRQAVILVLGSAGNSGLGGEPREALVNALLHSYREDKDPGVHGAAEWSLARLEARTPLEQARAELATRGMRSGYGWYVTKSGITMTIFEQPGAVRLGSPQGEPGRDASDEALWTCNLHWSFAVSTTEISQAQFHEIIPDYDKYLNEHAPTANCPANAVTWLDAVTYCRLLSERDGVPDSEMVIPPVDDLRRGNYANFITHSGYRPPIEAEWEIACRGGTSTARFFGYAPDLLPQYCCYIANSAGQSWPVASGLPNATGMFDMLGNVSEWCFDRWAVRPDARWDDIAGSVGFGTLASYAARGNDYVSDPNMIRAANRRFSTWSERSYSRGFRIAHTVLRTSEN